MIVGLIESGLISLTAWAPEVDSRATFAQSTVCRFRRWLDNERIGSSMIWDAEEKGLLGPGKRIVEPTGIYIFIIHERYYNLPFSLVICGVYYWYFRPKKDRRGD